MVLKGPGFSRAALHAIVTPALAAEGCFSDFETFPQGLKPRTKAQNFSGEFTARLKSCPFKTRFSRMQNLHAIALHVWLFRRKTGRFNCYHAASAVTMWIGRFPGLKIEIWGTQCPPNHAVRYWE
jgi:hypothetical protein